MRRGFCLTDLVVGACLLVRVVCSGLPVKSEFGCPAAVQGVFLGAAVFHFIGWAGPQCARQRGPWAMGSHGEAQPPYCYPVSFDPTVIQSVLITATLLLSSEF